MMPAGTRKKGALPAKVNHKQDGGAPGPSSGRARQSRGPVRGGRGVHNHGNGTPSRYKQAEGWCAMDGQRRNPQPARRGRPPSRRVVASPRAVGTSSDTTAASERSVDDLTRRTLAGSKIPSEGYVDELAALLDPNQPPSVVLTFRAFRDELDKLDHMPTVEDYLRVDPTIRPVGESTDDSSDE